MWVFVVVRAEGGVGELFVVKIVFMKNKSTLTGLHQPSTHLLHPTPNPNSAYLPAAPFSTV